jgi:glutathione peroxidase-family protein
LTNQNYQELPQLFDGYSNRGLKILAFPCNQFGGQEPGTNDEILEFVQRYDADMAKKLIFFDKADVNGANTREVYSFIKPLATNSDGTTDIPWNFGKLQVSFGVVFDAKHSFGR